MGKDSKPFIPFLIGLFFGWVGVKVVVHAVYLSIISVLIAMIFFK